MNMHYDHNRVRGSSNDFRAFSRRLDMLGAAFIGYSPVPLSRDRTALHQVAPAPGVRGRGLGQRIRAAWAALERARQRRVAVAELRSLNDRTLSDIGVRREDIPAVVDGLMRSRVAPAPARVRGPRSTVAARWQQQAPVREASNAPRFDHAA